MQTTEYKVIYISIYHEDQLLDDQGDLDGLEYFFFNHEKPLCSKYAIEQGDYILFREQQMYISYTAIAEKGFPLQDGYDLLADLQNHVKWRLPVDFTVDSVKLCKGFLIQRFFFNQQGSFIRIRQRNSHRFNFLFDALCGCNNGD